MENHGPPVLTATRAEHAAPGRRTSRVVLFVDNSWTFGGAIHSLQHLVDGLADGRIDPVVVSGHPSTALARMFPNARTVQTRVRVPWQHPTLLQRWSRDRRPHSGLLSQLSGPLGALDWHLRRTLPGAIRLARVGASHGADLVHLNNNLESQIDSLLAARLLRVPCVAHARGFQSRGRLLGTALGGVAHHVAVSEAVARDLVRIGAPRDRISVVHDGVDVEAFAAPRDTRTLRQALGLPGSARAFGVFGRIVPWKGIREFVLAASRVLRKRADAYALVVGDESDGERGYFEEVRELARGTSVADRILFTGYRDDVAALMQSLDVVVHTSTDPEPFGMVLVEAMAAGKPVVAADRGGPREIVVPEETGLLVDPADTEALASSITRLLDDPRRARRMGASGRRRAHRHFSKERYAREIASVYERILA